MNKSKVLLTSLAGLSIFTPTAFGVSCANANSVVQDFFNDAKTEFLNYLNISHISNEKIVEIGSKDDSLTSARKYLVSKIQNYLNDSSIIINEEKGNIYFSIPASIGCETYETIALQTHFDMAWIAINDYFSDIVIYEELTKRGNPIITSFNNKTSLGADAAQGVGLILSLIKNRNNFKHGELKFIFTADEETTCYGANNFRFSFLDGVNNLINFDGDGNNIVTGSLGDACYRTNVLNIPVESSTNGLQNGPNLYSLDVFDCLGGHSALALVENMFNPNKVISDILLNIDNKKANADIKLQSIVDNGKTNSVPNYATYVFTSNLDEDTLYTEIKAHFSPYKNSLPKNEKDVDIKLTPISNKDADKSTISNEHSLCILNYIYSLPWGILDPVEDLETKQTVASANIAPIQLKLNSNTKKFDFHSSSFCRFSVDEWKNNFKTTITDARNHFNNSGLTCESNDDFELCPLWNQPSETNNLIEIAKQAYQNLHIPNVGTKLSQAANEAAFFYKNNPSMNIIALSSVIYEQNTVNEYIDVNSFKDLTNVVLYILQNISSN